MRRGQLAAFVAGGACVALLAGTIPALAALTTAATGSVASPQVSIDPFVFRVGEPIDAATPASGDGCSGYQTAVPLRLSWTATAAAKAIVNYDLYRFDGASSPAPVGTVAGGSGGSLPVTGSNYESECGGGIHSSSYRVLARTGAAGTPGTDMAAAWSPFDSLRVWQENGIGPDSSIQVTRTGSWSRGSCTCFDWGRDAFTTAAGASARYTLSTTGAAQDIAVVAPVAPDRGRLSISVDGGSAQRVDTYAGQEADRIVIWHRLVKPGQHTVTVTNLATAGRPRIDIDSIMLAGT